MAMISEADIPGLKEEREMLERLAVLFNPGDSFERRADGSVKVDPTTFIVVIPGPAKRVSPYKGGTAMFKKEWAGTEWVCDWFDLK